MQAAIARSATVRPKKGMGETAENPAKKTSRSSTIRPRSVSGNASLSPNTTPIIKSVARRWASGRKAKGANAGGETGMAEGFTDPGFIVSDVAAAAAAVAAATATTAAGASERAAADALSRAAPPGFPPLLASPAVAAAVALSTSGDNLAGALPCWATEAGEPAGSERACDGCGGRTTPCWGRSPGHCPSFLPSDCLLGGSGDGSGRSPPPPPPPSSSSSSPGPSVPPVPPVPLVPLVPLTLLLPLLLSVSRPGSP